MNKQHRSYPMPWRTEDVLTATGGTLAFGDRHATHASISTDTRTIKNHTIFVALKGENHDAHRFLVDAAKAGATCIVGTPEGVTDPMGAALNESGTSLVLVPDTLEALGRLARYHRERSQAKVVAITGSNGKTTTRALTEAVLSTEFSVHATRGNFNNEVGLPLTLFRLQGDEGFSVLELGMNAPGEMTRLGHICTADTAVITCIGESHLEGLGSVEGVAQAKGELLETLKPGGTIILNADDPHLKALAERRGLAPIWFGFSQGAHVRAENLHWRDGAQHFTLCAKGETQTVTLPLAGRFMVQNALAAAAVGIEAGVPLNQIAQGLARVKPEKGRLTVCESQRGVHVIDDTYNANPTSVRGAITALKQVHSGGRAIAVLGDMGELGEHTATLHQKVGEAVAESGLDALYLCGDNAQEIRRGALDKGFSPQAICIDGKERLIERLLNETDKGDWVLVKGSRFMGMEQVVGALLQQA